MERSRFLDLEFALENRLFRIVEDLFDDSNSIDVERGWNPPSDLTSRREVLGLDHNRFVRPAGPERIMQ